MTDVPLSIDSSIVAALEAGLKVYKGKALVNSVTGEEERLEAVLPLVKKYGAAVVAISNDETGISEDPDVRFAGRQEDRRARRRLRHSGCGHRGRPAGHADGRDQPGRRAGVALIRRLREELKVNTTCGASNISFGLAARTASTPPSSRMVIGAGMTSAITNPCHPRRS